MVRVSDHAVLRYLERAHGLDIKAVRRLLAGHAIEAAQLGAVAVSIGNVKLVLEHNAHEVIVTTALKRSWTPLTGGRK